MNMNKQKCQRHEHPVGSRFEVDCLIYEVRLSDSCVDCACHVDCSCIDVFANRFGFCSSNVRSDGNNVIFVQVGEVE